MNAGGRSGVVDAKFVGRWDALAEGDWMGIGKSCIGIYRTNNGSFWLLDLNCNGTFEHTPTDAFFPFGGLPGGVPVVGAWPGTGTRAGVVRKYAPAGVPVGNPFYWVLDAGAANAGNQPVNHPADVTRCFAYGGLTGDVYVMGDWMRRRRGSAGGSCDGSRVPVWRLGGDIPMVGKW
jgi:hypothetical protein